jgi:hypothetical protein
MRYNSLQHDIKKLSTFNYPIAWPNLGAKIKYFIPAKDGIAENKFIAAL